MSYKYIENFEESRKSLIGASEIIKCIPDPEHPLDSLASWTDDKGVKHSETGIDLYESKVFGKKSSSSFAAEMGHFLEVKVLSKFIEENICKDIAFEFERGYNLHKMEQDLLSHKMGKPKYINPEPYNNTDFKHNTESLNTFAVSHADCLYIPNENKKYEIIKKNGLTIDMNKPFIIEAKTANSYAYDSRKNNQYKGYDSTIKGKDGIPLKVYFQVQYQMALYGVSKAYVSLIYNTSQKSFWEVDENKKHQKDLLNIAREMKNCIDSKTYPKQFILNSSDIKKVFPKIKEDFRDVKGEELEAILEIIKNEKEAKKQVKRWKTKENEATESIAIFLKDTKILKGNVNGVITKLAEWKTTKSSERSMGLSEIKKRPDGKTILNYMKRKKLINTTKESVKPKITIKESEME